MKTGNILSNRMSSIFLFFLPPLAKGSVALPNIDLELVHHGLYLINRSKSGQIDHRRWVNIRSLLYSLLFTSNCGIFCLTVIGEDSPEPKPPPTFAKNPKLNKKVENLHFGCPLFPRSF